MGKVEALYLTATFVWNIANILISIGNIHFVAFSEEIKRETACCYRKCSLLTIFERTQYFVKSFNLILNQTLRFRTTYVLQSCVSSFVYHSLPSQDIQLSSIHSFGSRFSLRTHKGNELAGLVSCSRLTHAMLFYDRFCKV